jgi:hypothetical protein
MVRRGELERVAASRGHADVLLGQARQHLDSARAIAGADPVDGYQLLYDAARNALAAVLENQGLRATSKTLMLGAGRRAARRVTWRHGSRRHDGHPVAMSSHFVFQRVRPAGQGDPLRAPGSGSARSVAIAEWPPRPRPPHRYLPHLPNPLPAAQTPHRKRTMTKHY